MNLERLSYFGKIRSEKGKGRSRTKRLASTLDDCLGIIPIIHLFSTTKSTNKSVSARTKLENALIHTQNVPQPISIVRRSST